MPCSISPVWRPSRPFAARAGSGNTPCSRWSTPPPWPIWRRGSPSVSQPTGFDKNLSAFRENLGAFLQKWTDYFQHSSSECAYYAHSLIFFARSPHPLPRTAQFLPSARANLRIPQFHKSQKTLVSDPYDDKKHINTLFPSFLSQKFFDTLQIIHTFATKIEQNLGAHGLFRPTTADLLSISRKSFILLHNS